MNRPISRPMHGLADYPYVAAVSSAPKLFGFEDEVVAARLCRVLSGGVLLSSVLTRAEWGFVRVVPYRTHLLLDVLVSVGTLAAPWLLGFSGHSRARNTFLAMGGFGLLAGLLSWPEEMPE